MIPRPRPNDNTGVPGTVYVLHFGPPYLHAGHYAAGLPATSMRASPRTCTGRGHRSRAAVAITGWRLLVEGGSAGCGDGTARLAAGSVGGTGV